MSDIESFVGSGGSVDVNPEPGSILITEGIVPLRFVVMGYFHDKVYLYCSARDKIVQTDIDEFMELENPSVEKWSYNMIASEINHETARMAEEAFQAGEV